MAPLNHRLNILPPPPIQASFTAQAGISAITHLLGDRTGRGGVVGRSTSGHGPVMMRLREKWERETNEP